MLLLKASDANPATLGAARAALGGALAPAEVASDAQAIAHALLGQVETLRRKPDRAIGHLQQVGMQLSLLTWPTLRHTPTPVHAQVCQGRMYVS